MKATIKKKGTANSSPKYKGKTVKVKVAPKKITPPKKKYKKMITKAKTGAKKIIKSLKA